MKTAENHKKISQFIVRNTVLCISWLHSPSGSLLKQRWGDGGDDDGGSKPDVSQTSEHYDSTKLK